MNDLAPSLPRRLMAGAVACALMAPAPAFAQGAGDDQYKDPFPETTAQGSQATPTETTSDGLSDTPPTSGSSGSSDSSGSGASASTGASTSGSTASDTSSGSADTSSSQLARTGDDPWLIALAGGSLLLLGAGLRLRGGAQRRH